MILWRIILKKLLEVKALLNMLQTEFIKLKRKWIVFFALLTSTVPPLITTLYTFNLPKGSSINAKFTDFYQFTFTEWVLLPIVLGMIASMIFFDERENCTLKQIMIVPVNKALFIFSKFTILLLFSILFMLLNALFTVLGAFILGYPDITRTLILRLFSLCIQTGFLTAFAIFPIVAIVVIAEKGYILPTCASLIYSISGLILSSNLVGVHPLSSVAGIVWNKNIEGIKLSTNLTSCILNITIVAAISIVVSIYSLKMQDF